MSFEREIDKAGKNVRDAVDEAKHRTSANVEKTDRELNRDQMTGSERIGSVIKETKENVQADIDKSKRDLRNETP